VHDHVCNNNNNQCVCSKHDNRMSVTIQLICYRPARHCQQLNENKHKHSFKCGRVGGREVIGGGPVHGVDNSLVSVMEVVAGSSGRVRVNVCAELSKKTRNMLTSSHFTAVVPRKFCYGTWFRFLPYLKCVKTLYCETLK